MNNDINLISGDLGVSQRATWKLDRVKLIAKVTVLGVGLLSILLFLLSRVFSPQSIIKQQNEVIAGIAILADKQAKLIVLNQRVNDISTIFKKRKNYDLVLSAIIADFPANISITSLSVDKSKISAIVSSSSLISLNDFIDSLKGMVEKKQFLKNVTINNLNLNGKTSGYILTLDMDLL